MSPRLDPRLMEPRRMFPKVKKVFRLRGKKAMFLTLEVRFHNGTKRMVEFLVDTGAEVSLIRPDLVPAECVCDPTRLLTLVVATNDVLGGGDKSCHVDLIMYGMEVGREDPQVTMRRFPAELYLGAIQVEGILSFDWLRRNRMGVVTHKHCLLWDTQWPEWLFDVVPRVEEEEEGEGIASMRLTPRRRRQRELSDVNTISEQELEVMLARHHWVPPQLPPTASVCRCWSKKERKSRVVAQVQALSTFGL